MFFINLKIIIFQRKFNICHIVLNKKDNVQLYLKRVIVLFCFCCIKIYLFLFKYRLIKARPYLYGENLSKFPFDIQQQEEETASSSVHWEN